MRKETSMAVLKAIDLLIEDIAACNGAEAAADPVYDEHPDGTVRVYREQDTGEVEELGTFYDLELATMFTCLLGSTKGVFIVDEINGRTLTYKESDTAAAE